MISLSQMGENYQKLSIPTSSAVVSEVQIKTSSDVGRDCELSCMYKDSTVPKMSSVIGFFMKIKTICKSMNNSQFMVIRYLIT